MELFQTLKNDASCTSVMPYMEIGITERDANLSLLSYAFNLNPALRHQLSTRGGGVAVENRWRGWGSSRMLAQTWVGG